MRRAHAVLLLVLAVATLAVGMSSAHADIVVTRYIASSDPAYLKALLASNASRYGTTVKFKDLDISDGFLVTTSPTMLSALQTKLPPFDQIADYDNVVKCVSWPTSDGTFNDARWNSFNNTAPYYPNTDGYSATNQANFFGANVFKANGFNGQGIDVALIDTGVFPVGDLADPKVVIHGPDFSFDSQAPNLRYVDQYGHGTHMAGIIHAVAPAARIVSLKVGSATGAVDVSQVIAAVDWAREHRNMPGLNIKVINLAYGTLSNNAWTSDELSLAIDKAWQDGIVVVVSAGNIDPADNTTDANSGVTNPGLLSPAYNQNVLAVGAYDTHGLLVPRQWQAATLAPFSSASTRQDPRLPDVGAPGASVVSYRVPNGGADGIVAEDLCNQAEEYSDGSLVHDVNGLAIPNSYPITRNGNVTYIKGSGTSQAAAMASGSVALMLSSYNKTNSDGTKSYLSPDAVKKMLKGNAHSVAGGKRSVYGDGAIDLLAVWQATPPWTFTQSHDTVTGNQLEGSRGGMHVVDPATPGQSSSWAGTMYTCKPPDGGTNPTTPYRPISADDKSVSLCGEQDIYGNFYNYPAHDAGVAGDTTYQLQPAGCSLTTKVGAWKYKAGAPACTAETWGATAQPITALPAVDSSTGDLTSFPNTTARGFVPDTKLGFVWPSTDWSANAYGAWGWGYGTGTATNWAHVPWATAVQSSISYNVDTGWSQPWNRSSWRDESWDAGSWRLGSWRAGSWRLGSWRRSSWRLGSWRDFGFH
ncbi:MAG TPA: S8 family serine peptidase [Acidimicrobiia bacterium]|jgi:serine protease AprX|nr:S8 family serine peptidase [Acidimicrobiia bacterium]